jgi:hypothetical protein
MVSTSDGYGVRERHLWRLDHLCEVTLVLQRCYSGVTSALRVTVMLFRKALCLEKRHYAV